MNFNYKITGGKELDAALSRLALDVETRLAKNAAGAGARVIRDGAKRRAPVDSGNLRAAIKVRRAKKRYGAAVADIVVTGGRKSLKNDAWYAKLVEYGTRHAPARPFLRPALDADAPAAIRAIATSLSKQIAKLAGKHGH